MATASGIAQSVELTVLHSELNHQLNSSTFYLVIFVGILTYVLLAFAYYILPQFMLCILCKSKNFEKNIYVLTTVSKSGQMSNFEP